MTWGHEVVDEGLDQDTAQVIFLKLFCWDAFRIVYVWGP